MRFSYAESMCDPSEYVPLARAADGAGWTSFVVPDSICYPEVSDSKYPYTPDGDRRFLKDTPFLEPFSLIPALGAVTERLRFTTFVVKLPIRHPVLVAKQAACLDVLCGGRFRLGIGVGWNDVEFVGLNENFHNRGRRSEEQVEVMQALWAEPHVNFQGRWHNIEDAGINPRPASGKVPDTRRRATSYPFPLSRSTPPR